MVRRFLHFEAKYRYGEKCFHRKIMVFVYIRVAKKLILHCGTAEASLFVDLLLIREQK
jgi:hypothetical protein